VTAGAGCYSRIPQGGVKVRYEKRSMIVTKLFGSSTTKKSWIQWSDLGSSTSASLLLYSPERTGLLTSRVLFEQRKMSRFRWWRDRTSANDNISGVGKQPFVSQGLRQQDTPRRHLLLLVYAKLLRGQAVSRIPIRVTHNLAEPRPKKYQGSKYQYFVPPFSKQQQVCVAGLTW